MIRLSSDDGSAPFAIFSKLEQFSSLISSGAIVRQETTNDLCHRFESVRPVFQSSISTPIVKSTSPPLKGLTYPKSPQPRNLRRRELDGEISPSQTNAA